VYTATGFSPQGTNLREYWYILWAGQQNKCSDVNIRLKISVYVCVTQQLTLNQIRSKLDQILGTSSTLQHWPTEQMLRRKYPEVPDDLFAFLTHSQVVIIRVMIKFTLEAAKKAQRGSRLIALLFLQPRPYIKVGGQRHAPAASLPGKTRYPLYKRLGGPQGRSGCARKPSHPSEFVPRRAQPVASRYTDWAIAAHQFVIIQRLIFY